MKGSWGVEAIGFARDDDLMRTVPASLYRELRKCREISHEPWAAEITGTDERYGLARQFLPAKRDFTGANSAGSRGVWFWYTFESGRYYEVCYRTSWQSGYRGFKTVTQEGDVVDVAREEVERWAHSH